MLPQMNEAITLRARCLKEQSSICMEMGQGDSCRKDFHSYFYPSTHPPPKKKMSRKEMQFQNGKSKWIFWGNL